MYIHTHIYSYTRIYTPHINIHHTYIYTRSWWTRTISRPILDEPGSTRVMSLVRSILGPIMLRRLAFHEPIQGGGGGTSSDHVEGSKEVGQGGGGEEVGQGGIKEEGVGGGGLRSREREGVVLDIPGKTVEVQVVEFSEVCVCVCACACACVCVCVCVW